MKLDLVFTEQEEKINLDFGEYSVISDGGYEKGYTDGYDNGYVNGESVGYANGYKNGEDIGHSKGFAEGEIAGQIKGKEEGEQIGYENALSKLEPIEITANGEYLPSENEVGFNKVSVNVKASTPKVVEKEVDFIDYDGTLLYSYSVEEAKALTELPPLPEQDGLICQGWNWSLEDIKEYLNTTSPTYKMTIGAMYITDDGKTRIYISLNEGRLSPYLGFATNGTVIVDWGDGSETLTVTGTSTSTVINNQHIYSQAGDYVISLEVVSGNLYLLGNSTYGSQIIWKNENLLYINRVYQNAIKKVEIGANCNIGSYAFRYCVKLTKIIVPHSVTSISSSALRNCYALTAIIIPNTVTSLGGSAFSYCYTLTAISIPNTVTSLGDQMLSNCYALATVTISNKIGAIGNVFIGCESLASVTIPNSVTYIGTSAFATCYALASVTIPNTVTSLGANAFQSCYGMKYYDFTQHTSVPTLANTSAFTNIPSDCEIRVPMALVDEWKSATNWSTYASKIVGV